MLSLMTLTAEYMHHLIQYPQSWKRQLESSHVCKAREKHQYLNSAIQGNLVFQVQKWLPSTHLDVAKVTRTVISEKCFKRALNEIK